VKTELFSYQPLGMQDYAIMIPETKVNTTIVGSQEIEIMKDKTV
jgi:hypothetical protein